MKTEHPVPRMIQWAFCMESCVLGWLKCVDRSHLALPRVVAYSRPGMLEGLLTCYKPSIIACFMIVLIK